MLLVLGLAGGSSAQLIGSIGVSLLAAVALVIGIRRTSVEQTSGPPADGVGEPRTRAAGDEFYRPALRQPEQPAPGGPAERRGPAKPDLPTEPDRPAEPQVHAPQAP